MQQLLDYIAILAFVIVYFVSRDIFIATGVLMVGVTLQVAGYWLLKKPIGNELKLTFWVSMIMGGMTLILRDETFIQWKPTVVNWLLGGVLVVAHLAARTFLMKRMLGHVLHLPDAVWLRITYGWAMGFVLAGALNLWVAFSFSMDVWVTFKLGGLLLLNIIYVIATFGYLYAKGLLSDDNLPAPESSATGPADSAAQATESKPQNS